MDTLTILRGAISAVILSGIGMLAMGVGLVPVFPPLEEISKVFIGDTIPLLAFLRMLGVGKIVAVLGVWGYGPLSHNVALVALSIPASCAIYGHYVVEGPLQSIPPVGYIALLVIYFVQSRSASSSGHPNEKKE